MILNFMTQWPKTMPGHLAGKPTRFPQKIAAGIPGDVFKPDEDNELRWNEYWPKPENQISTDDNPKLHTIREDTHDRWKVGMDIHFYVFSRSRQMLRFAPKIKVKAIQKVRIKITSRNKNNEVSGAMVWIDGFYIGTWLASGDLPHTICVRRLAKNDGFNSIEDFFAYFNKDFTGKIIHWTDLKY